MPKVVRFKEPAKLRITVKNSVDKPIIIARVPTMDNRSFQRLIFLYPQFNVHGTKVTYILYYVVFNITIHFCYFLFLNSSARANATIEGNVTITKAVVTKNTLHFEASGPEGATGWINVTFPMVNTTEIKVFINKVKLTPPRFPIITTNGTHYFIYFEFTSSTKSIAILFSLEPPIANFTWAPSIPKVNQSVTFDGSSSSADGVSIVSYEWGFGHGGHSSGKIVAHTYTASGFYTVTLNITDSEGFWDIEQKQIQVVQPCGPKAEFTATPETADVGESVKFDASDSLSGFDGTHGMPITEYRWDFGGSINITTPTPIVYYSFISPGIYYVTLTVYAPGATLEMDSTTHKVTVISAPVGGYSIPIKGYTTEKPLTLYLALTAILTVGFAIVKRRKKQQN